MKIVCTWLKENSALKAAAAIASGMSVRLTGLLTSLMKGFLPFCLLAVVTGSKLSHAEYRAHRLKIENTLTGQSREVVSTLDHLQYKGYYPLALGERVQLAGSWRCRGRTSRKPICPDPLGITSPPAPQTNPAPGITPQG